MKYYLIVGEASGDLHASNLMKAIRKHDQEAEFRFYGGDKMAAVGGQLVRHYRELAYMGFIPVLLHLRTILRNMRLCKQDVVDWAPDALILVDYPGFNLSVAKYIHTHTQIPVYYYISPKIWAWKEWRIKSIRRYVDELFSILPFEVDFFEKKHHYPIHYVGNPCVDAIEEFRAQHPAESRKKRIALLPGSRKQEISDNLPTMLKAVKAFPDYDYVVAGAPSIDADFYEQIEPGIASRMAFGETYSLLSDSVAALVTSGTATLETALLDTPQVVCYYLHAGKLMRWLKKVVLTVPYISLVNLIAGREVVTELIGDQMNEQRLKAELARILPDTEGAQQMLGDYKEVQAKLGPKGASDRAAELIVKLVSKKG